MAQTFANFSADAQDYIAAKTLMRLKREVIVYGLAKKEKLPNRFSKTFQYSRYEKLNLPQTPLSEGVTPVANTLVVATVTAVMDQWGDYISLSDVAQVTVKHPVIQEGIQTLAEQAAETIDRELIKILLSNTSVYYPGAVADRPSLATTDVVTSDTVRKVVAALRNRGARGYEGRMYVGLIDPSVEMDLNDDTTFTDAASYQNLMVLQNGEVGRWMGVRWVVSNLLPTLTNIAAVTAASSATAGSLTASTAYDVCVTAVDDALGFEQLVSKKTDVSTDAGETSIDVTMPATTGYTYNVYIGADAGIMYQVSTGNAASASVNVGTLPTSGTASPAVPADDVVVHYSWVMGKESFSVPELMSLQTFMTNGGATDSDPLAQRRKLGWKVMFKGLIPNETFMARIESASGY